MTQGRDIPCNNCNDGGLMGGLCYCDDEQAARIADLKAKVARYEAALTPSAETKAAYIAEVECYVNDCRAHVVPWKSIKRIMRMIAARAALEEDQNG